MRHQSEDAGAAGIEAQRHRIDLRIETRPAARDDAKAALQAVRDALAAATAAPAGWRCVLMIPVFADVLEARAGASFAAVLRLVAVIERNAEVVQ